ncbi:uncharacterized protein LOC133291662 [Gastrolobium bilobum]|uniref:uncharacterized protein LOC133291662 n=1 Tax=Gastrolobium bilobum TaxID=150636 RepID=UPI002AB0E33B|nr:uncharacterized protein LOC133291662 [Gastrolobium bilobum]
MAEDNERKRAKEEDIQRIMKGVHKKGFIALIRELKFRFNFKVMVLLETKCSGRFWVLWDDTDVHIQILLSQHQIVHAKAHHYESGKDELISFLYASPRRIDRRCLWESFSKIASSISNESWMVMGDFNAMLLRSEKKGGSDFCWNSASEFRNCLTDCLIKDIGFSGPSFTWKRNELQERLDRVCVNERWNTEWENKEMVHLPFYSSDHRPILITNSNTDDHLHGNKPFRFLASWLTAEDFGDLVSSCWRKSKNWSEAIDNFQTELLREEETKSRLSGMRRGTGFWNPRRSLTLAVDYFEKIYTAEETSLDDFPVRGAFPHLEEVNLAGLGEAPSNEEIKSIVFNMGKFKAPGPDGLQAVFYQSQWNTQCINMSTH